MNRFFIVSLLTIVSAWSGCKAQHAVVTAGGHAKNEKCSVSYTIGQVAMQAKKEGKLHITEGVQQTYEIFTVGDDVYPGILLEAIVYPNPTEDLLHLKLNQYAIPLDGFKAMLFDNSGHLLETKTITDNVTDFQIGHYSAGVYFLEVDGKGTNLKTFKIIRK
jgi:hypothetical protein